MKKPPKRVWVICDSEFTEDEAEVAFSAKGAATLIDSWARRGIPALRATKYVLAEGKKGVRTR